MFYYLKGELVHREPTMAVIDCAGVAYALTISLNTSDAITPLMGKEAKLMTYLQVREDGVELFGFSTKDELETFKLLIGVSGVGPKAAMSILSMFTPERLRMVICTEDTKGLAKAPNIGAKTAARIILELRDKIAQGIMERTSKMDVSSPAPSAKATGSNGKLNDALQALMALGYDRADSMKALSGIDTESLSLNDIIAKALKKFL
jgi:Holliday junction DNA helicase RuvA